MGVGERKEEKRKAMVEGRLGETETDAGEKDKRRSEEVERTLKENQREDRRKWIGSEFLVSNDTRETSEMPHTRAHTHMRTHRVKIIFSHLHFIKVQ